MATRPMTPVYYQGKKRHYDLLQRTAALTNGDVPDLDLNRPEADPENEIIIVADKMVTKEKKLEHLPKTTPFLTVSFVDKIRGKAKRGRRALFNRISESRLKYLLAG